VSSFPYVVWLSLFEFSPVFPPEILPTSGIKVVGLRLGWPCIESFSDGGFRQACPV